MLARTAILTLPPLVCLSLTGCGEPGPKLVKVTGKVEYKGKPLTSGSVTFHPAAGGGEPKECPSSMLQLDGTFTLVSVPFGDGAKPGKYRVVLSSSLANGIGKPAYGDPTKTPWTVDVPDGGLTDKVLEVK